MGKIEGIVLESYHHYPHIPFFKQHWVRPILLAILFPQILSRCRRKPSRVNAAFCDMIGYSEDQPIAQLNHRISPGGGTIFSFMVPIATEVKHKASLQFANYLG